MPTMNALLTAHPYKGLKTDPAYIAPADFYNENAGVYVVAKDCSKIEEVLRENAQPAIIFRLNGYAGCGKTMFAHYLIRKYGSNEQYYYEFDEGEGRNYSLDFVINRIIDRFSNELALLAKKQPEVISRFEKLGRQFSCRGSLNTGLRDFFSYEHKANNEFEMIRQMLSSEQPGIAAQIRKAISISVDLVNETAVPPDGSGIDSETFKRTSVISFLLIMDFLLRHALISSSRDEQTPVFCLLDNLDNLRRDVIADLYCAILDVIEIIMDFYHNFQGYETDFSEHFRLIFLVPTRAVTYRKLRDEVLSKRPVGIWEKIDNTFLIELSLDSETHGQIIEKRLQYWEEKSLISDSQQKQFEEIEELIKTKFASGSFSALFNDNYSHCVRLILDLFEKSTGRDSRTKQLILKLSKECVQALIPRDTSKKNAATFRYMNLAAEDAKKGIFLRILLEMLKENGAYASPNDRNSKTKFRVTSKLGLIPLNSSGQEQPYSVSLSRLLLTYLCSKTNHTAHINELFDCFSAYNPEDICRCVYALSENIRDVWRRLVMFNRTIPTKIEDLYVQAKAYKNEDEVDYTEIELCKAGEEYLMLVVPSFEFYLSRLDQERNNLESYPPLFCSTSIRTGKWKRSIQDVLQSVETCAGQLYKYDTAMIDTLTARRKEDDIQHLFVASRKDNSIKQTHLSRIVFSHVSYLDHFRMYYLWYWNYSDPQGNQMPIEQRIKDNELIVSYIIRYLTLFNKHWTQEQKYSPLFDNRFLTWAGNKLPSDYIDSFSVYNHLEGKNIPSSLGIKNGFQNQCKAQQSLLDQILKIHELGYATSTFEIPVETEKNASYQQSMQKEEPNE